MNRSDDNSDDGIDDDDDEREPGLSAETLAALKEFALSSGILLEPESSINSGSKSDIVSAVARHFDVKDKYNTFNVQWKNSQYDIKLSLKGIKRELGQTLSSTGLTIWSAAEYLCDFVFNNPGIFQSKTVCELGCGLGMVSILLAKLNVAKIVVATDGDDDTIDLLKENIASSECSLENITASKLYWGEEESKQFQQQYPDGFDIIIAADVIYEREQVEPLILTSSYLLKKSGSFYLSFHHRNVNIDIVLNEAILRGLLWELLDDDVKSPSTSNSNSSSTSGSSSSSSASSKPDRIYRFYFS